MKLSTPRWWYQRSGAPAPLTRLLLRPLGWIYAASVARRIAKASPYAPGVPVISVGNLTVGGSGKTPIVREILAQLRDHGVTAYGLSRGYGGSLAGPVRVDPLTHSAAEVGDEPIMLAGDGPFVVARDRAEGARFAVAAGAQALVLDDAHQNPLVKKDLSLVIVDGETRGGEWPFGDEAVFPAGPLREPLDRGLARADAVIVLLPNDVEAAEPELLARLSAKPVYIARLKPLEPPPAGPQLGFAGIAKPWKVERSLRAAGCQLVDFIPFPDHKPLSNADLAWLRAKAADFGAGLVTTEKDWARLAPTDRADIRAWPVAAVFDDPAAFNARLASLWPNTIK